jgi:hypothetical protein
MCKFQQLYCSIVPTVTIGATALGILTGISMEENFYLHKKRYTLFTNIIACGTIGAVTGATFPISFPIITYHVMRK